MPPQPNDMDLSGIHFHDSVLRRVIEHTEADEFHMEVDYPVNWQEEQFEPKSIVFTDVLGYEVHEGDVAGCPTILGAQQVGEEGNRIVVRIDTTAGYRQLQCRSIELRSQEAAA